eukprot:TRINITY_DN6577_c0_g1_i6.p1 TRINITY_DN6577_c0_g1~~TRINITY_DN6577_c0_g1_i6.p1  ORF type:complete len:368 (-),score=67.89 TRINITY_DN6577_c0_g1_i6:70-1173(-)
MKMDDGDQVAEGDALLEPRVDDLLPAVSVSAGLLCSWEKFTGALVGAAVAGVLLLVLGLELLTQLAPSTSALEGCSEARVAVCMCGNRFMARERFNLNYHFLQAVILPLGGVDNVDVFISSEPEVFGSLPYRTLMAMLHHNTLALNTFEKLTRPGSLGVGVLPDQLPPAHPACVQNPGEGLNFSVYSPSFTFNTYVQQFRRDQCMRRVMEQEETCGRRYDWVVLDRDDAYYGAPSYAKDPELRPQAKYVGSILRDGKRIDDLAPSKLYNQCGQSPGFGMCDTSVVAHRTLAEQYFLITPEDLERCWSEHEVECLRTSGHMHPECLLRTKLTVSYTHLRAHETPEHLVCRLLLEKKKKKKLSKLYKLI